MKSTSRQIQVGFVLAFLCGVIVWVGSVLTSKAQGPGMSAGAPAPATWRPDKNARYVGAQACAKCHEEESKTQHATAMGRALEHVATSEILRANPALTFRSGPYTYQITRRGDQSIYSVTDGKQTISTPILYAFGQGKAGQTYIFQRNGSFQESRVSFYKEIKGLDWTIGYERAAPPTLEEAVGRSVSTDEARNCFGCHTTASTTGTQLQLERMIPGVSCEACHGPGADHIVAMEAKNFKNKRIFNPGQMNPDELSQEFCGSCHRSAEQVSANSTLRGINSVRFQPYRLFTSRGHDPFDERLSCTACHNPHQDPKHDAAFYDAKCFACHRSGESLKSAQVAKAEAEDGRDAKPCPVSQQSCASCHMPRVEIPGSHTKFTDHRIRISREGEPFPN
ncbi:MAG TPA: multiheme c-type cytochrome [Pyrinomonadaceae bacterium]